MTLGGLATFSDARLPFSGRAGVIDFMGAVSKEQTPEAASFSNAKR